MLLMGNNFFIGGIDYLGPDPLSLTFISGQTVGAQRCSAISVIDDTLIEAAEGLSISLTPYFPSDEDFVRLTIGQDIAAVIIVQDPNDSMSADSIALHV